MKKIFSLAVIFTLFLTISNANATDIAVIDMEKVVENCVAMKNVNKKLTNKKNAMQKQLQKEEGVLNAKRDDISSKSNILSKSALEEKMKDFQRDVVNFQKKVKEEEDKLKVAYMEAIKEVTDEIKVIVEEIREDEKYNFDIVITSSATIFSDNDTDISSVVLRKLNKRMKSVALSI
jgi:outer membrane protein